MVDGEPGVKSIWIGPQRVIDFAAGIRAYKTGEICVYQLPRRSQLLESAKTLSPLPGRGTHRFVQDR